MPKKQPENWRDLLKKNAPERPTKHGWVICGGGGGGSTSRQIGLSCERDPSPPFMKYKCLHCGATATKTIPGGNMNLDNPQYQGLTCKEVQIHYIIT